MEATMNNKKRSRRIILFILLIILVAALLTGLYFWQRGRLRKARLEASNPAVFIHDPAQGSTAQTGRWILVNSSATGLRLMDSIELWINGDLIEIQESGLPGGVGVIHGQFPLLVQEGAQTIVVRAIDTEGYIGQSDPLSITGISTPEDQQPSVAVPYGEDHPLEAIAGEYQIPFDELVGRDPDLPLEPAGIVQVPIRPEEENIPAGPEQIPADQLTQNGYISGKICYPSQYIPEMTAYFENTTTGQITTLPIALNQNTYGIFLPPGEYTAYAWLPDFSLGGTYSKAVPCGLTTSCTDHSLIKFQVTSGSNINGIDICDWYDLPSVPTPPGAPPSPAAPKAPQIASGIPMLTPVEVFPATNQASLPYGILLPLRAPGVPENFSAENNQCKIKIGWDTPEPRADGYFIWLTSQTGNKQLAADLETEEETADQAWYEFTSPVAGLVSVWVEAYNVIGSTSSTVKTLKIPADCSSSISDELELKTLELRVGEEYRDVYFYLSAEGNPENRFPADDSDFLAVESGQIDLSSGFAGAEKLTLTRPDDGNVQISGECWGWAGGSPTKLSSFDLSIPENEWNDTAKEVGNHNCSLGFSLKEKEDHSTYETMSGKGGSSVPPPFNVRSLKLKYYESSLEPSEEWSWFWEREIRWQWPYDIKQINGFSIYQNGVLLKTVPANVRSAIVILPSWCGDKVDWKVVANAKKGSPSPSQPAVEMLPYCGKYAEVVFDWMHIVKSCDSCCCGGWASDTYEAYITLSVNGLVHTFGNQDHTIGITAGNIYFKGLTAYFNKPKQERFLVPISKEPVKLRIDGFFYDYDWGSADDQWARLLMVYHHDTFQDALKYVKNPQGIYQPYGLPRNTYANGNSVYYRIWYYQSKSTQ